MDVAIMERCRRLLVSYGRRQRLDDMSLEK